jgi:hypothetical protein
MWWSSIGFFLSGFCGLSRAIFEAKAVVSGLEDRAVHFSDLSDQKSLSGNEFV